MKRPILLFCFILFFLCSCQSKKGDSLFLPLSELKPLTLGMMPTHSKGYLFTLPAPKVFMTH